MASIFARALVTLIDNNMSYSERRRREDEALAQETSIEIKSYQNIETLLLNLPKMVKLESLTIQHCEIDDSKAVRLAAAIKNCKVLHHLDLQYNCIGEIGFTAIIEVVISLEIRVLYIQGRVLSVGNQMSLGNLRRLLCKISLSPEKHPTLVSNPDWSVRIGKEIYWKVGIFSVRRMCLSEMNLGDAGATILANSFSFMVSLTTLFFYDNGVGAAGASAFIENLPKASALEYFNLSSNPIPQAYIDQFEMINAARQEYGLSRMDFKLSSPPVEKVRQVDYQQCMMEDSRWLIRDEEAKNIARDILTMENGEKIDFYLQGKRLTVKDRILIETANQMRIRSGLKPLEIIF
jgi:hypothetical protein